MNLKINISANKALFNLKQSSANLVKDLSKLSSANKITSPEDDSAGLSQVIRMEAELKRNNSVQSNLANFVSLVQTQDGILGKATEAIKRMSELSILAQDIVKTDNDRISQAREFKELQNLLSEMRFSKFNGIDLFSDSKFEVIVDSKGKKLNFEGIDPSNWDNYLLDKDLLAIDTTEDAESANIIIKSVLQFIGEARSKVGANLNIINKISSGLKILNQNLSAATSIIKDVKLNSISISYTKIKMLYNSNILMLEHSKFNQRRILDLLDFS